MSLVNLVGNQSVWELCPNGQCGFIIWEPDGSLRIESFESGGWGGYTTRETYDHRHPVTAGQRVYIKTHIKAAPWLGAVPQDYFGGTTGGGRIIIDFYSGGSLAAGKSSHSPYVEWGTEADRSIAITVPDGVDEAIMDLQVRPELTGTAAVWFSKMEMYVLNPDEHWPGECPAGYHWDAGLNSCVQDTIFCCPCDVSCFETQAELTAHIATHTCAENEFWNWATCRCETKPVVHAGCFIATMCGASDICLDVLRSFRDKCMPRHLILLYYLLSPGLASLISTHVHVKAVGRRFYDWLACQLRKSLTL